VDLGTVLAISVVTVPPVCAVLVQALKLRLTRQKLGLIRYTYKKGGAQDAVAVAKAIMFLSTEDSAGGTSVGSSGTPAQECREVGCRHDDEQQCA
jgi:hypothetical protein